MGEVLDPGDTHLQDRIGEECVVGGDDEIARPGEHQPAGDARPLDHRDRRLGELSPAAAHAEVKLLLADEDVLRPLLVLVASHHVVGEFLRENERWMSRSGLPMSCPAEK